MAALERRHRRGYRLARQPMRQICLILFGLLLAGCARPPADVLRVGLPTPIVTLDPRYATDAASTRLCHLIYAAPADFDTHFMPVPSLMEWSSPTPAARPTRWRLRLRGNPRFHDGSPLAAADVVATYRAVLDPARASPHRGSLANLRRVRALDARTVEFELERPDPLFPGLLVIGVLPAALADGPAVTRPVGSGPFAVRAVAAKSLGLERVADGQRVDFEVVEHEMTRALKLLRGELDLVQGGFAPELADWLARQPGLVRETRPGTTFSYLGFNFARGPTVHAEVREAISLALDRRAIVERVFRGQATLASAILTPGHWAGAPRLPPVAHDPARARALLLALGHDRERPLRIVYKTSSDQFRLRLATILQAQLADVGIALEIRSHDWGTFYADVKAGNFELYGLSWVGLQLPDIFRHAFHSRSVPPAGANRGRYASVAVDGLIEAAERAAGIAERAARYGEIQARLLADLAYAPLWYEQQVFVRRTRVIGYDTGASGDYDALSRVTLATAP